MNEKALFDYDIVVIGAGPAGANFARLVDSERYRVLLINGAQGKEKVCGGLVSPDAQDMLARYDITLPKDILVSPQLFSVRTIDLRDGYTKYYRRNYMNVSRERFDRLFLDMIPSRVKVISARCRAVEREENGFRISIHGETDREVRCRYLIGADGAASIVRSSLYPNERILRYTAIQQWFDAGEQNPYYSCIFDNESSPGCSWIFFKDGSMVFGGAFAKQNSRKAFEIQKQKLVELGIVPSSVFEHPKRTEACLVCRPKFSCGLFFGSCGAYLIGEAAGLISPSSFEGISYALHSSQLLAEAFGTCDNAGRITAAYRRSVGKLRRKIRMKCLKRPFMYHPLLRRLVMKSGILSIKVQKNDEGGRNEG